MSTTFTDLRYALDNYMDARKTVLEGKYFNQANQDALENAALNLNEQLYDYITNKIEEALKEKKRLLF